MQHWKWGTFCLRFFKAGTHLGTCCENMLPRAYWLVQNDPGACSKSKSPRVHRHVHTRFANALMVLKMIFRFTFFIQRLVSYFEQISAFIFKHRELVKSRWNISFWDDIEKQSSRISRVNNGKRLRFDSTSFPELFLCKAREKLWERGWLDSSSLYLLFTGSGPL